MTFACMGIDLGSTTAKSVVVDGDGNVLGAQVVQMGAVSRKGLEKSMEGALSQSGLAFEDIRSTIGTGYGRRLVPGAGRTFTEITCHARGVAALVPGVRLVIDIGGQDSKAILVNDEGLVDKFAMNDRCASGTGRFFDVVARALEVSMDELGPLALSGAEDLEISSMCATFAETEIIALMAEGRDPADIAASVHRAISARALGLVAQVGRHTPAVLTGGVARNAAAVKFMSEALGEELIVPADPQVTGAFGAALLAVETETKGFVFQGDVSKLDAVEHEVESSFRIENRAVPECSTCSGGPVPVTLGRGPSLTV
ncbi:2-hydroxyglutaryl-CoA dehydratase [Citricoccus zhacaiensis]|uniref:2-hydroxyglutaryl-CoA dehydratase n=1 Tax=Citricoccus zhacaiensis TaxID=489142 RepID=A0ABQ2LVJ1_9MICC|nr:acyl-CoA dehydratase activase [Citricoccus zhacaiensis]GGO43686.1 2-hydroxyglutaryl-CoA dehydratase [Citricoccus zhacaiensis]